MLYSAVSFNRKFHTEMYHFAQLKLFVSLRQVALALTYQSLFVVFEWWEERSARSCEITRGKKRGNRFEAISWIILYFLLNFTQAYSLLRGHSTAYNLSLERFTHRFDIFSYHTPKKERKKCAQEKSSRNRVNQCSALSRMGMYSIHTQESASFHIIFEWHI